MAESFSSASTCPTFQVPFPRVKLVELPVAPKQPVLKEQAPKDPLEPMVNLLISAAALLDEVRLEDAEKDRPGWGVQRH